MGAAIKFELLTIQNLSELDVTRLRINRETTRRRRRHVDIFLTARKYAFAAIMLESSFVGAACLGAVLSCFVLRTFLLCEWHRQRLLQRLVKWNFQTTKVGVPLIRP